MRGVFPLDALEVSRSLAHVVGEVLRGRVEFIGRGEAAVIPPVQIKTHVCFDAKSVKKVGFEEEVSDHLIGFAVAIDQPQAANWIDVLLLYPWRLCEAVLRGVIVDRCQWIVGERIRLYPTKGTIRSDVVVVGAVDVEVLADGDEILVLLGAVVAH